MFKNTCYRGILRLPNFRGKAWLETFARKVWFCQQSSRIIKDMVMELDPLEWTQITLIRDGVIEPLTVRLYEKLLRPGDTYIDVGAHVGFHTLVARNLVGHQGRVVAIEPQPYNCEKILANWGLNRFENLFLYVAAAGDRNSVAMLHEQSLTDKARLSLVLEPINDQPQRFQVPLVRLDTVFDQQQVACVRLLKIDTEGYESEVIAGLGQSFDIVENIVVEVLGTPSEVTHRSSELIDVLSSSGYDLSTVEGDPWEAGHSLPESNLWASRRNGKRF